MQKTQDLKMSKAYTMNDLSPFVLMLVVIAIIAAFSSKILTKIADTESNNTSHTVTIVNKGQEGILEVADWLPTLALIVIATIIIGIIMYAFGRLSVRS